MANHLPPSPQLDCRALAKGPTEGFVRVSTAVAPVGTLSAELAHQGTAGIRLG